ncbi:MAG TPA: HGxxPAAW family protein [Streptosporangiaceae bacterium]|nr:HGxxPAAW family protein [Streptosporangiaceae bacterium]
MSEQVRPATAEGVMTGAEGLGGSVGATASSEPAPFVSQVPGTPVHFPTFHGRGVSWFAVTLILIGFVAGGLALVFGPTWWLFWVSLAVAVVGALIGLATGIFDDWY